MLFKKETGEYNFKKDLRKGIKAELVVANIIRHHCRGATKIEFNKDEKYDILVEIENYRYTTIEVKRDFLCSKTGNVAIEIWCRNKPSGIMTSKAMYWTFVFDEDIYIVKKEKLKNIIESKNYPTVEGGDLWNWNGNMVKSTIMVLVPFCEFENVSKSMLGKNFYFTETKEK